MAMVMTMCLTSYFMGTAEGTLLDLKLHSKEFNMNSFGIAQPTVMPVYILDMKDAHGFCPGHCRCWIEWSLQPVTILEEKIPIWVCFFQIGGNSAFGLPWSNGKLCTQATACSNGDDTQGSVLSSMSG